MIILYQINVISSIVNTCSHPCTSSERDPEAPNSFLVGITSQLQCGQVARRWRHSLASVGELCLREPFTTWSQARVREGKRTGQRNLRIYRHSPETSRYVPRYRN